MSLLWTTAVRAYYHGTDEEFEPGDLIRPQSETGAPSWAHRLYQRTGDDYYRDLAEGGPDAQGGWTGEHVYHASAPHEARDFGRNVYEVEPLTPVEKDPESGSWTRNRGSARVIREVPRR